MMNKLLLICISMLVGFVCKAELKILDMAIQGSGVRLDFLADITGFRINNLEVQAKTDLLNDEWNVIPQDSIVERTFAFNSVNAITGAVTFVRAGGVEFYRLRYDNYVSESINVNINGTLSLNGTNILDVVEYSDTIQRGCVANLAMSDVHSDTDYYGVSRQSMSSYDLSYMTISGRKVERTGVITRINVQNKSDGIVTFLVATNSVNNTAKILKMYDVTFTGGVANVSIPIEEGSLVGLYQTNKIVRRTVQYDVEGECYYCRGYAPSIGLNVGRWGTNRRLLLDWELTISYEENVYSGELAVELANRVDRLENLLGMSKGGLSESDNPDVNVLGNLSINGTNIVDIIEQKVAALEEQSSLGSMKGVNIVVFGDSLMAGLNFSNRLRDISGANVQTFARGGTYTVPTAAVSVGNGLDRIFDAVNTADIKPDIILYENVNDYAYANNSDRLGAISDRPWMLAQYIEYDAGYADIDAARAGFIADFNTIIAGHEKLNGTIVRIHYGEASSHGGEGMRKDYYYRYFIGYSAEEFDNIESWSETPPTLHACYKGMIEFLIAKFPRAKIVLLATPIMAAYLGEEKNKNPSFYMYEDGTWNAYNTQRYGQRWVSQETMATKIEGIANLYNLGFVNVFRHCNINIINLDTWYRSNNVHPYSEAYERWAEIVYKYLMYQL